MARWAVTVVTHPLNHSARLPDRYFTEITVSAIGWVVKNRLICFRKADFFIEARPLTITVNVLIIASAHRLRQPAKSCARLSVFTAAFSNWWSTIRLPKIQPLPRCGQLAAGWMIYFTRLAEFLCAKLKCVMTTSNRARTVSSDAASVAGGRTLFSLSFYIY